MPPAATNGGMTSSPPAPAGGLLWSRSRSPVAQGGGHAGSAAEGEGSGVGGAPPASALPHLPADVARELDEAASAAWRARWLAPLPLLAAGAHPPTLVILRALSGAGKSTLATALTRRLPPHDVAVCSADDYFVAAGDGTYKFDPKAVPRAHAACQAAVWAAMTAGVPLIIVDNTHTRHFEYEPYVTMLESFNADVAAGRARPPRSFVLPAANAAPLATPSPTGGAGATHSGGGGGGDGDGSGSCGGGDGYVLDVVALWGPQCQAYALPLFADRNSHGVGLDTLQRQAKRWEHDRRSWAVPPFIPPSATPWLDGVAAYTATLPAGVDAASAAAIAAAQHTVERLMAGRAGGVAVSSPSSSWPALPVVGTWHPATVAPAPPSAASSPLPAPSGTGARWVCDAGCGAGAAGSGGSLPPANAFAVQRHAIPSSVSAPLLTSDWYKLGGNDMDDDDGRGGGWKSSVASSSSSSTSSHLDAEGDMWASEEGEGEGGTRVDVYHGSDSDDDAMDECEEAGWNGREDGLPTPCTHALGGFGKSTASMPRVVARGAWTGDKRRRDGSPLAAACASTMSPAPRTPGHVHPSRCTWREAYQRLAAFLSRHTLFLGFFLSHHQRRRLLEVVPPMHPLLHATHATAMFLPPPTVWTPALLLRVGTHVRLAVTRHHANKQVQAVTIDWSHAHDAGDAIACAAVRRALGEAGVDPITSRGLSHNRHPHITISTAAGAPAKSANHLVGSDAGSPIPHYECPMWFGLQVGQRWRCTSQEELWRWLDHACPPVPDRGGDVEHGHGWQVVVAQAYQEWDAATATGPILTDIATHAGRRAGGSRGARGRGRGVKRRRR